MPPTPATPTQSLIDEAHSFQEKYRKARNAAAAFLDYSCSQLINKLASLSSLNAAATSRTLRTIHFTANQSMECRMQAWRLPGTDLYMTHGIGGFVRIEDSNREEGTYVSFENILQEQAIGEESTYIKVAKAIAELDEYADRRQHGGNGFEG
jgi:hypothetical protein